MLAKKNYRYRPEMGVMQVRIVSDTFICFALFLYLSNRKKNHLTPTNERRKVLLSKERRKKLTIYKARFISDYHKHLKLRGAGVANF